MRRPGIIIAVVVVAVTAGAGAPALAFDSPDRAAPDGSSSLGATGPGSSAVAEQVENITVMTLEGRARHGFANASLDVATTTALRHDAASARLDGYAFAERIERAPGEQARTRLLFERTTRLRIRASELRVREARLRDRYRNRSIGTDEFVRRLAALDARAAHLERRIERVGALAAPTPEAVAIAERLNSIRGRVSGLHGPARAAVGERLSGSAAPTRVFAAASANGLVVALVAGDEYVREAYRADFRTPETVAGFGIADANARARQLYPTAYDFRIRFGVGTYAGATSGAFVVSFRLPAGSLTALLDGSSANVYYEVQRRDLGRLSPGPPLAATANGTRLVVNRTFPGGPLRIATYGNATGDPVSVPVRVGNEPPLVTGRDGVSWTVGPRGRYTVTAIGPTGNTTIRVWPVRSPTLR